MRVRMDTVVVGYEFRRRLRMYSGEPGLATRQEVRAWYEDNGESCDNDLYDETDDQWREERDSPASKEEDE